jgi:HSP20 family protein
VNQILNKKGFISKGRGGVKIMALMKRNSPVDVVPGFQNIPTLFDSFFGTDFGKSFDTFPSVNIKEGKDDYVVELAAPGFSKENFTIQVEKNVLTLSGKKEDKKEEREEGGKYQRQEFSYSSFERSFVLPEAVNEEKIDAEYKDGILMVKVPKTDQGKERWTRKIEIK